MTNVKAREILKGDNLNRCCQEEREALEMIDCLTDRPCGACKYNKENGCSKWECVFEEGGTDG